MATPVWTSTNRLVALHDGLACCLVEDRDGAPPAFALRRRSGEEGGSDELLRCVPPPPHCLLSSSCVLRRGRTQERVCIFSRSGGVFVAALPPHSAVKTTLSPPTATLRHVGDDALAGSDVMDVQWHPFSDAHLVVLTTSGLYIFDIAARDVCLPCDEWQFPSHAFASPPACLAFGAPRGWEIFAVYIGCEDGSLFYLLPVLPTGCLLPAADWGELVALADHQHAGGGTADDEGGDGSTAAAFQEAGRISSAWLRSSFVEEPGEPDWVRFSPQPIGHFHDEVMSHPFGRLAPALQGPVAITPSISGRGRTAPGYAPAALSSLAVLPGTSFEFASLVLAFGDGGVVSVAATEPLLPAWGRPARSVYSSPIKHGTTSLSSLSSQQLLQQQHLTQLVLRATPAEAAEVVEVEVRCVPAGVPLAAPGIEERAAPPWLLVEALSIDVGHPLAVAQAALEVGGGAFPGGSPGAGLAGASSSSDHSSSRDTVGVPYLLSDPSLPSDVVLLVSRHGVHAIQLRWMPGVRSLLAQLTPHLAASSYSGGSGSGGGFLRSHYADGGAPPPPPPAAPSPSLVREALFNAQLDIIGACVVPEGSRSVGAASGPAVASVSAALLVWTVPAYTRACALEHSSGHRARSRLPGSIVALATSDLHTFGAAAPPRSQSQQSTGRADDVRALGSSALPDLPPFAEVSAEYDDLLARCSSANNGSATGKLLGVRVTPSADVLDNLAAAAERAHETIAALQMLKGKLASRAAVVAASAEGLDRTSAVMMEDVRAVSAHADAARRRLQLLVAGAENLRARAHAIMFSLALRRGTLSHAEHAYVAEINALHAEVSGPAAAMVKRLQAAAEQQLGIGQGEDGGRDGSATVKLTNAATAAAALEPLSADVQVVQEAVARARTQLGDLRAQLRGLRGKEGAAHGGGAGSDPAA